MLEEYEYALRRRAWWNGVAGAFVKGLTIASLVVVVAGGIITIAEHLP